MTMRYQDEAGEIWREQVPSRGQADTVQGELIRAVEKLRDEAWRNGNVNWSEHHERLVAYVRDTLLAWDGLDADARAEVERDTARLLDFEHPETGDEPYDRLSGRVVEWSRAQDGPIAREHDPELGI